MGRGKLAELLLKIEHDSNNEGADDVLVNINEALSRNLRAVYGGNNIGCSGNQTCDNNNTCTSNGSCNSNVGCSNNTTCNGDCGGSLPPNTGC